MKALDMEISDYLRNLCFNSSYPRQGFKRFTLSSRIQSSNVCLSVGLSRQSQNGLQNAPKRYHAVGDISRISFLIRFFSIF